MSLDRNERQSRKLADDVPASATGQMFTVARIETYYQQNSATQIEQQGEARSLAECLSYAVASVYFGSGAFPERNMPNRSVINTIAGKKEFLGDIGDTLRRIGDAPVPHTTYQLVQILNFLLPGDPAFCFGLFADIMRTGGKRQGFQLESLGVDVMLMLISQCLADYRLSAGFSINAVFIPAIIIWWSL